MTTTTFPRPLNHRVPLVYVLVVFVVAAIAAAVVALTASSGGSGSTAGTTVHQGTTNGSMLSGVPCPGNVHDLSC
jgi:hypothetical protein